MKPSEFKIVEKPRLTNLNFQLSNGFNFDGPVNIDVDTNVEVVRNPESNTEAIVVLSISLYESKPIEDVPFHLSIKLASMFEWDSNMNDDHDLIEKMLSQNAPAILLGYARPIISGITVDANLPPLVLPLMNFVENDDYDEEASE